MRICGIEIKSKTAVSVILEAESNNIDIIEVKPSKFQLGEFMDQAAIQNLHKELAEFCNSNNITKIYIKEGVTKGKFSSGSAVFKIEALFQMLDIEVELIKSQSLSAYFKKNTPELDASHLKKYQQMAFNVAYYGLKHSS